MKIALLGATSKTGRYVVPVLCDHGHTVIAIGRDRTRLAALDQRAQTVQADILDSATLRAALEGADCVASLAHARYTGEILDAVPPECGHIVLTGSLRKFTRLPDPAADAVRAGEARLLSSGRTGVMLHPSMIYGAPEDRNVNRVLSLIARIPRWLPVVLPLPGGGRHTVQPVFVDDMVAAFVAAIETPGTAGPPIAVAGPHPITYREMIETCGAALGRRLYVVPVSLDLLLRALPLIKLTGVRLPVDALELTRATENKAFDISDLRNRLGVHPRPFAEGLAVALARRNRRP